MSQKEFVVFDLDGTISQIEHRVHLAASQQWDEFHQASSQDGAHYDAIEVFSALQDVGLETIILTGRNERYRNQTVDWLSARDIYPDKLLMRPNDDFTPDHELKPELLFAELGGHKAALEQVLVIFEDRDKVVEAWRNLGFVCYQVRNGSY